MEDSKEDSEIEDDPEIMELYGCDDDPFEYMIEPKGTVRYRDKNHKTTVEELKSILPELDQ